MFDVVKSWYSRRNRRIKLLAFLAEMEKNLEIFYVCDQRQFITGCFLMDQWEVCKEQEIVKRQEAIRAYAALLLDFNMTYKEYKEFEEWYSSDINRKTKENALKLHSLKNSLQAKLKPLESVIIFAGQILEKEMLNLGFITD